ncbi:cationic trypsin [Austrofundulus limnaeus]|uniref:Cationic trypsin n=1 Tax=Austrofundulus limnaeus TaxID=52670 RepID=A0A2I4DB99_AUSLI|nr:PREDICTED: cationic trypsin-like [Austrofundulus limnaeus]
MRVNMFTCGVLLLLLVLTAPGSEAETADCGLASLNTKEESRIVGGQTATPGAWPWQAYLQIPVSGSSTSFSLCGGSLISNQWVLTAAHCFQNSASKGVTIYLGRQNPNNFNPNEQQFTASQVIVHPNHNSETNDNDVALLQLSSTVTFNKYISPVCLATADSVFPAGLNSWVTGFGTTSSGGSVSTTLQEVNIPIVSNSACNAVHGSITSNMICAGLTQGGKDSCQGDSGGPLVSKNGTRWVQAGVVSFGDGCARPNIPGVYARVSRYESWISSTVTGQQPGFVNIQNTSVLAVVSPGSSGAGHFSSLSIPLLLSVIPVVFSVFVLS